MLLHLEFSVTTSIYFIVFIYISTFVLHFKSIHGINLCAKNSPIHLAHYSSQPPIKDLILVSIFLLLNILVMVD